MTFGSVFGRTFSPTFQPSSQAAAAAGGWWDLNGTITGCIAAYQPKGAVSLVASYTNLVNPGTNNAAPGTAPDWDSANGWKFNGTSHYLDTGYAPTSANKLSIFVRYSNFTYKEYGYIVGCDLSDTSYYICLGCDNLTAPNTRLRFVNGYYSHLVTPDDISANVFGFSDTEPYINGADVGTVITATYASNTTTLHIGKPGGINGYYSKVDIQALVIYNAVLTSTQVGLLTTAMAAL